MKRTDRDVQVGVEEVSEPDNIGVRQTLLHIKENLLSKGKKEVFLLS